ncbi:hypothetical protein Mapa_015411 [Marchantia paleacea]|nr:hypothetical protein Mapa_015411 [Marchantia paleacea]
MGRGQRVCWIVLLTLASVQCVIGNVGSEDLDKIGSLQRAEVDGQVELPNLEDGADFDYYVFSQQWPGTFCRTKSSCCKNVVKPVKFTVHGLWPENEDNTWPSCCSGPGFDESKVAELYDYLVEYWPTLSCNSPQQCKGRKSGPYGFWQHEWEKHGTCSYPIIPDEATYFSVGLNLHLRYDISKILSDAGFFPSSRKYKTSDMKAAVSDAIGAKPAFSCKGQLINEIWVCLTKELKIRDCGMPANTCGTYTQIPPFVSKIESYEEDRVDIL